MNRGVTVRLYLLIDKDNDFSFQRVIQSGNNPHVNSPQVIVRSSGDPQRQGSVIRGNIITHVQNQVGIKYSLIDLVNARKDMKLNFEIFSWMVI